MNRGTKIGTAVMADYYAQDEDGSVWYLGERVEDYENGRIVGHTGQWIAGVNGARAGVFMPPKVGVRFDQERAPGVAEDHSTVVEEGLTVRTQAGTWSGCIKTRDVAPLDGVTEFRFYCPGAGLVREQAPRLRVDLVSYLRH